MRTATEIIESKLKTGGKMYSIDPFEVFEEMKKAAIDAINEAKKEAIEAAAEKCKGASMMGENEIKQSILSLINELK